MRTCCREAQPTSTCCLSAVKSRDGCPSNWRTTHTLSASSSSSSHPSRSQAPDTDCRRQRHEGKRRCGVPGRQPEGQGPGGPVGQRRASLVLRGHNRLPGRCESAWVENGSSTLARKRRTWTSTTLVSLSKFMSQTCSAMSVRDSTSPAPRSQSQEGKLLGGQVQPPAGTRRLVPQHVYLQV